MSLNEIKKRLGTDSNDLDEIRKIIKREISKVHPDKYSSDGKFPDEYTEKKYNELMDMLNFIETIKNQDNNLYVSQYSKLIEQQNQIIKQQNMAIELNKKEAEYSAIKKLNNNINDKITEIKSRGKVPKVSLAAFNSFIGFIFLFPEKFKNHPIIGPYFKAHLKEFTLIWIAVLIYTVVIFAYLALKQRESIKVMNMIKSEQYQDYIFDEFMYEFIDKDKNFDKSMLINHMYEAIRFTKNSMFRRVETIESDILYEVSDIVIKKALNKNIIEEVKTNTLRDRYKFKY